MHIFIRNLAFVYTIPQTFVKKVFSLSYELRGLFMLLAQTHPYLLFICTLLGNQNSSRKYA